MDSAGNVLLTGSFQQTAELGGGPVHTGGYGGFVTKLDASGNPRWSVAFGDWAQGDCVAADSAGNVLVTGYFHGSPDFGGSSLQSAGGDDIFLAKWDASGNLLWVRRFGDASSQTGESVAVDASGNAFLAGYFDGAVDFGSGVLESAGGTDVFLAKLSP